MHRSMTSPLAFLVVMLLLGVSTQAMAETFIFTQEPIQPPSQEEWALRKTPVDGCRIARLDSDGQTTVLTPGFASAAHPCVSYDGERFLFAGKQQMDDQWDIWQMRVDGTGLEQITQDMGDCWSPIYMARGSITPPEFVDKVRWITFVSTAAGSYDLYGSEKAGALYAHTLEPIEGRGTVTWRTTFNLSSDFSPTMLNDGRVLFSSWQHYGDRYAPHGKIALLTINWAGTGLNVFYGNHEGATVNSMATEMPDRTVVFVESDGSTPDASGDLVHVSFRRPLHSRELLAEGRFRNPQPTSDGGLVVSHAPDGTQYGLYRFDLEKRQLGEVLHDDSDWNDLDAQCIMPRPEPQGRITIVTDTKDTAHLQCMNVYDSDQPEAAVIEAGDVKWARFLEGLPSLEPRGAPENPFPPVRILGEIPVEPDGSFYVHAPADMPFTIQLLDADRIALQEMQGWMWIRRGSRRGCIGCHENKEMAPENRVTEALLKATAHDLLSPPEERKQVQFAQDVLPIIERRCQRCHSGAFPKGGLDLSSDVARPNLGHYLLPGKARESRAVDYVFGKYGEQMPPNRPLPDAERQTIAIWVDLGAQ